eukprot:CAMPEP_0203992994 /NCGR_PEP_ID=MMETSP0360-20130528/10450_1 /ASSEMBLY_ACC=CAM_ASM_000342 /TAXON_ID=268821 /ORGANISM="Scrippsiella Hangoei, Strain SHTV-5" /LENGTH=88 /DNA_ID=CAMNT_0050933377 /DNA_START=29 /DNA_END=292 /DNA_ORIENTATION=+
MASRSSSATLCSRCTTGPMVAMLWGNGVLNSSSLTSSQSTPSSVPWVRSQFGSLYTRSASSSEGLFDWPSIPEAPSGIPASRRQSAQM